MEQKTTQGNMAMTYDYYYSWGNNSKRAAIKHRRCRIVATGKMNSVMIEFEDGQKEIVSRYAIRKFK